MGNLKTKGIVLFIVGAILFSYPCDARRTKDASSQAEGRLLQLIQTVTQREQEVIIAEREDFSNGVLRFLHFKEHTLILLNSKAVGLLSDHVLEEEYTLHPFTEEETEIIASDIFPYLEGNGFEVIFPFELEVLTVSHWDDIATEPVYIAKLDSYDLPIQIKIIEWLHNLGFEGGVVYDPMCSSGAFLENASNSFTNATFIGSDFSEGMVTYAKNRLNGKENVTVFRHDASGSLPETIPKKSIDVLIFRGLNIAVVDRAAAAEIFEDHIPLLHKDSIVFVAGLTDALLTSRFYREHGFRVINMATYINDKRDAYAAKGGLINFYVLIYEGSSE